MLKKRAFKKSDGFTMVEVIVTLAILSTSMIAVFGILRMCSSASNGCKRLTEGVMLAEKLLAETTLSGTAVYQTTTGSENLFKWEIQTAPTGMDNLVSVRVTVQWPQQERMQEYELISLMHLPDLPEGQ